MRTCMASSEAVQLRCGVRVQTDMKRLSGIIVLVWLCGLMTGASAQDAAFYPGASYDPNIPTLKQIVGHEPGEQLTTHAEAERYLQALTQAAPRRTRLVSYGETWQKRKLYYLVIASEANIARLDQIKADLRRLADPRTLPPAEADRLIETLPAVTWLAYGVHGNEISSTDAGLLMAYHLLAARGDPLVQTIFDQSIVVIDPMQNPDGRERFINYYRQTRGRWPDPDPQAAEHNEVWPSGRSNHYLFDMNRDWFAQTQPETRGRVKAFLEWFPHVFVDLHEMGSNETYFFPPPAPPVNPEVTPTQNQWLARFGRNNARWFDRMNIDYFTREIFDAFYPGYGEGWPMFHGAIGMTYEQASARGLVVRRKDDTLLHYRDGVRHHFIASIATAEVAATERRALLRDFYEYRRSAIQEGERGPVKEYIIAPGSDPNRAAKLVATLMSQGIEVKQASTPITNAKARDYYSDQVQSRSFPAGTYVVSLAQPAKRLAHTLLAKHTPIEESFLKEQVRRYQKRMSDQFYDVTAWSLPLMYDVECYAAEDVSRGQLTTLQQPPTPQGRVHGEPAKLAYLIPWGSNSAAKALTELLRQGVRVYSTDKALALSGRRYPSGSLIIKVKDNPADLHQRLTKLAADFGVDVYPTDTAWVDEGVNFGSSYVKYLKKPRVAMAYNTPTSSLSAGWMRYLLEQEYGQPITVINTQQLGNANLKEYDVLILPNGSGYERVLGESGAQRIKQWIETGGTLISIGEATRWLTEEKVGLLASTREYKPRPSEKSRPPEQPAAETKTEQPKPSPPAAAQKPGAAQKGEQKREETKKDEPTKEEPKPLPAQEGIEPDKELPGITPGAIMRITLDTEHWLAFGYDGDANVLVESRNIFTPIKLDQGINVGRYMTEDKVLLSGFTWDDAKKQIAGKAYLMYQPHGRGHVIAFAEEPNYRAFTDGLHLLLLNAIFFTPAR